MDQLINAATRLVWLYIAGMILGAVLVGAFLIWFVPTFIREWRDMDARHKEMRERHDRMWTGRRKR